MCVDNQTRRHATTLTKKIETATHAKLATGAYILERAHTCIPVHMAVSIFFARVVRSTPTLFLSPVNTAVLKPGPHLAGTPVVCTETGKQSYPEESLLYRANGTKKNHSLVASDRNHHCSDVFPKHIQDRLFCCCWEHKVRSRSREWPSRLTRPRHLDSSDMRTVQTTKINALVRWHVRRRLLDMILYTIKQL